MPELILGLSLGWAAGIAPGPLHTLVLTTSLQRGFAAGARVAVAPLLTDLPIVALSVLAVGALPAGALRWLGALGGTYIVYLGVVTLREAAAGPSAGSAGTPLRDLRRGFVTNFLNPHPWIFWVGVGAPILVSAWGRGPFPAAAFLVAFYGLLVGTKLVLAALGARGRRLVASAWYPRLVAAGGALLVAMGALLLAGAVSGRL